MLEDITRLLRIEHEIDGNQHRAQPGHGKSQGGKGMGIARKNCNSVRRCDADGCETRREAVAKRRKLCISPTRLRADDGNAIGVPCGAAPQQVRDILTPKFG